jgi:hypothetical protein
MLLSLIKLEVTRVINNIVNHDSSVTQKPYWMHNKLTSARLEPYEVCGSWARYIPTAIGRTAELQATQAQYMTPLRSGLWKRQRY